MQPAGGSALRGAEKVREVGVLSKINVWAREAPGGVAYLDGKQREFSFKELAELLGRRRGELLERGLAGKRVGIFSADPYDLGLAILAVMGVATAAPLAVDLPLSLLRREVKRLHLDVVVGQGATIFQQLACEDRPLLIGRDALLILDFGLHIADGI